MRNYGSRIFAVACWLFFGVSGALGQAYNPPTLSSVATSGSAADLSTGTLSNARLAIPDYGSGCTLSNNVGTPNTVLDIAACATANDTTFIIMPSSGRQAAYTKTTGAWAVGTGNGGLDTGAVANSTWYYVYQIQRSDTGVVDYLLTATFGSPTMPAAGAYNRKRYIGAIKTDGSGNIVPFTQLDNYFMWTTPISDATSVSIGTARTLQTLASVPSGHVVRAHIRAQHFKSAVSPKMLVQNPAEVDVAPNALAGNMDITSQVAGTGMSTTLHVYTNTAQQIALRSDSAATSFWAVTVGWADPKLAWPH